MYDKGLRNKDLVIFCGGVFEAVSDFKNEPEKYKKRTHMISNIFNVFAVGGVTGIDVVTCTSAG